MALLLPFFVLLLYATLPGLVLMLLCGVAAILMMRSYQGQARWALVLLVANLCEPLVTVYVIARFVPGPLTTTDLPAQREHLLRSMVTPAILLLAPVTGLFLPDARWRWLSVRLLVVGLLRCAFWWVYLPMKWSQGPALELTEIGPLFLPPVVYCGSGAWGLAEVMLLWKRRAPRKARSGPR